VKKIYFIRDAKAKEFTQDTSDFERELRKKGYKELQTIASYLMLRGIKPDVILSSCALRAQQTALFLSQSLCFDGEQLFLEELYYPPYNDIVSIIMAQERSCDVLFIIGHAPYITELTNSFCSESIGKMPPSSVAALHFEIEDWSEIGERKASLDFFIYPKQFKYYMPKQIRATLKR
jgi:phosphohistidine phosphatase